MAESVTINSINLSVSGAWELVSYAPLYGRGGTRGRDIIVPGADGRTARARKRDEWRFTLDMYIFGNTVGETMAAGAGRATLEANTNYLIDNLVAPYTGSSTVTLSHLRESAATVTAPCIVESAVVGSLNGVAETVWRMSLAVVVPSGELV